MTAPSGDTPLRVTQIVTTLARGGAQATVVASSTGGPARPEAEAAETPVEVVVLAGAGGTGEGSFWGDPALDGVAVETVPHLVRSIRPFDDLLALRWLITRLRSDRPDVVHTHSSKAGVLGRLAAIVAGVPCVHTVHGWGPLEAAGSLVRFAVVSTERVLARGSAALVVVGRADLERGLALGIGQADQYRLIRSGIDLPDPTPTARGLARAAVRAELDLDGRWVVGMVGRLAPQKDQAALVEAVAMAAARTGDHDITLVLVGDGPERPALEALAGRWPWLDVRFLGARPDGARLVTGFDLAVNASRWEGLPRAVVEAASAGVPVVASAVGSTADLIRPGQSGRLVRPGDASALAEAILTVRMEPDQTAEMVAEAERLAAEYSTERMCRRLRALWAEVAGTAGADGQPGTGSTAPPSAPVLVSAPASVTRGVTWRRTRVSTRPPARRTARAADRGRRSSGSGSGRMRTARSALTRLPRIW